MSFYKKRRVHTASALWRLTKKNKMSLCIYGRNSKF